MIEQYVSNHEFKIIFRVMEVLDEDNLVQEVMHRNTKLISYLCKEETLKEMIELIVKDSAYEEVSLDDTDRYEDIQRRFKRANQGTWAF